MKSSAMRDLMAITARPEVISLAGGLPDTSTFPAETFAALIATDRARVVRGGAAVRADRGPRRDQAVHRRGDGGRGHARRPDDMIVTTGGQQVIDLVTQDADRPRRRGDRRGADLPGRGAGLLVLPGRRRADRDGRRRHARRPARGDARRGSSARAAAEVHLHGPDLPEPGRRDDVARAPRGWSRSRTRARAARARGQPVRPAALRGRAAAPAVRARRRRVRDLPRHVLEDPLAGHPARAGPRRRARCWRRSTSASRRPTSARRRSRSFVATLLRGGALARLRRTLCEIYRRRRDAMLDALAEYFPREAEWTQPGGGLFIWATLPDFIDTTDLLAQGAARGASRSCPAGRVPRRPRRHSMRLNFSGVGEDDIREGIRRIGKVVREQVALYGTLTGAGGRANRGPAGAGPTAAGRRASCRTSRPSCAGATAQARDAGSPSSRAAPRSSARSRCAPAPGSRTRSSGSATTWSRSTSAGPGRAPARERARRRVRRAARARRRGRHRAGAARDRRHPLHRVRRGGCIRCMDKVLAKHACATPGSRRRTSSPSARPRSRSSARREALPAIEERLDFPIVVKPAGQGSALGIKFARTAADVPEALVAAFSYDTGSCSSATSRGATSPSRCSRATTA